MSRLKRDTILIKTQSSGRYTSTADPRFTIQWPKEVAQNDIRIDTCIQPVDLPTFTQFCQHFLHESHGLLAVGPIIDLTSEDITLLKPIQFTLPILVQPKKKKITPPKIASTVNGSEETKTTAPPPTTSQPPTQETLTQQQQSIFKSMLGEGQSPPPFSPFKTSFFRIDQRTTRSPLFWLQRKCLAHRRRCSITRFQRS